MSNTGGDLKGCTIGIELYSGERVFGKVHRWTASSIWIIKEEGFSPLEVPRYIIRRALLLLEGYVEEADIKDALDPQNVEG